MDMSTFELYVNIMTLVCGVYLLYVVIKLRQVGHLFPNQILIPKDAKLSDCLDEEGYISFISPRLLIVGLLVTLTALVCLADSQWHLSNQLFPQIPNIDLYITEVGIIVSLVAIGLYIAAWMKGRKLFWV